MPLTDAERAKRYREKKKQRDPSFIEKERKRQQMLRVGETGVGCHMGWLSHCQYLIRWMAVPCVDLHVTCA